MAYIMAWAELARPRGETMKSYYSDGKRGSEGGIPIWRPKWYGELGNDAEFREATKPRTALKAPYYEGGHRMTIDGVPIRLASHVKGWRAANKAKLCQGAMTSKEQNEVVTQVAKLFQKSVTVSKVNQQLRIAA